MSSYKKLTPAPHSNSFYSGKARRLLHAQLCYPFHIVEAGDFYGCSCCHQLHIFIGDSLLDEDEKPVWLSPWHAGQASDSLACLCAVGLWSQSDMDLVLGHCGQ